MFHHPFILPWNESIALLPAPATYRGEYKGSARKPLAADRERRIVTISPTLFRTTNCCATTSAISVPVEQAGVHRLLSRKRRVAGMQRLPRIRARNNFFRNIGPKLFALARVLAQVINDCDSPCYLGMP
jgi:hypothetical protein